MILPGLACAALAIATFNALLFLWNLRLYSPPPSPKRSKDVPAVSVLIPARNEEHVIAEAVKAALASEDVRIEVIVLDDHSTDGTAEIVHSLAASEPKLRVEGAPELPSGWCGKQFACSVLAGLASHEILCFIDSDVRLRPEGLARMVTFLRTSRSSLVSGFPHQDVQTFFEKLLLPLMHFLLLGFLPLAAMRKWLAASLGAGCGQIFVARRSDYFMSGGHAAIRGSRHDGLALPKAFRRAGFPTDLCDATNVAECRMYRNRSEVFNGLLKNANEGIAAPIRIFVFTVLLLGGHVLPEALAAYYVSQRQLGAACELSFLAVLLSLLPRLVAVARFRQPVRETLLHPLAMIVLLGLQWYARARDVAGMPALWKGRAYQTT